MKVVFDLAARDDLDRIFAWIANDNPSAAHEVIRRIETRVELLATPGLAHMGRRGLVQGTRELVEPPYILSTGSTRTAGRLGWCRSCTERVSDDRRAPVASSKRDDRGQSRRGHAGCALPPQCYTARENALTQPTFAVERAHQLIGRVADVVSAAARSGREQKRGCALPPGARSAFGRQPFEQGLARFSERACRPQRPRKGHHGIRQLAKPIFRHASLLRAAGRRRDRSLHAFGK
jgi:toxin ParE1/3/4